MSATFHRFRFAVGSWVLVILPGIGFSDTYTLAKVFDLVAENVTPTVSEIGALALCSKKQHLLFGSSSTLINLQTGSFEVQENRILPVVDFGVDYSADCEFFAVLGINDGRHTPIVYVIDDGLGGYVTFDFFFLEDVIAGASGVFTGLALDLGNPFRIYLAGIDRAVRPVIPVLQEVDVLNDRIIRTIDLTATGAILPTGLDIDPASGDFYMSDRDTPAIYRLDSEGVLIEAIDLTPFGLAGSLAVAFNPLNGHIFVGDRDRLRILELAPVTAARHWVIYR